MEIYEIWREGFCFNGEEQPAQLLGKVKAKSFDNAVKVLATHRPQLGIQENTRARYIDDDAYNKRLSNWNVFGCNLFSNETNARKTFG